MSTDVDPMFADRCTVAADRLRQLAEIGTHPDTDEDAANAAALLTASLLADPEALLAVALIIEQQRDRIRPESDKGPR